VPLPRIWRTANGAIYELLSLALQARERIAPRPVGFFGSERMNELGTIDGALDEMLVNLAGIVLRLAKPDLARTPQARHALVQSVHQYSACAARSTDPRVHELKEQLEETLKPSLRVVVSDRMKVS
jgi:tRNA U38,U39,U40 pseudouridine synthase TruA